MLTKAEQKRAAKAFAKKWEGRGYEKGESQPFWLMLLQDVFGIKAKLPIIIGKKMHLVQILV